MFDVRDSIYKYSRRRTSLVCLSKKMVRLSNIIYLSTILQLATIILDPFGFNMVPCRKTTL